MEYIAPISDDDDDVAMVSPDDLTLRVTAPFEYPGTTLNTRI